MLLYDSHGPGNPILGSNELPQAGCSLLHNRVGHSDANGFGQTIDR